MILRISRQNAMAFRPYIDPKLYHRLAEPQVVAFGYVYNRKSCGAVVALCREGWCEVKSLYVEERIRHHGVGTALMDCLVRQLQSMGIHRIYLEYALPQDMAEWMQKLLDSCGKFTYQREASEVHCTIGDFRTHPLFQRVNERFRVQEIPGTGILALERKETASGAERRYQNQDAYLLPLELIGEEEYQKFCHGPGQASYEDWRTKALYEPLSKAFVRRGELRGTIQMSRTQEGLWLDAVSFREGRGEAAILTLTVLLYEVARRLKLPEQTDIAMSLATEEGRKFFSHFEGIEQVEKTRFEYSAMGETA